MFVVYASMVGARKLAELQTKLSEKARTLSSALGRVDGILAPRFEAPYLGDFTIELKRGTSDAFLDRLRRRKILGGQPLRDPRPGALRPPGEWILVSATESVEDRDIQKYAKAAAVALPPALGAS